MKTVSIRIAPSAIIVSIIIMLTCLIIRPVHAVSLLDQSFTPDNITVSSGIGGTDKAQTFTVGIEGILTSVEAYIYGYGNSVPLRFDIRSTIGGLPINDDTNVLASLTYSNDAIPNTLSYFSFDVSSLNIQVHPGEVYAIVLMGGINNPNTGYSWMGGWSPSLANDPYKQGAAYFRNPDHGITSWTSHGYMRGEYYDLGFRTFVESASVPESATMLLFGAGLAGLGIMRKRFKV